jgi:very-short-patch-repair endonuclease
MIKIRRIILVSSLLGTVSAPSIWASHNNNDDDLLGQPKKIVSTSVLRKTEPGKYKDKPGNPNGYNKTDNSSLRYTTKKTYADKEPKVLVNLKAPYPKEWKSLSVRDYFKILGDNPSPQIVIDWCKGMYDVLIDDTCINDVTQITLARCITLLGQKAKQNRVIRQSLLSFFKENPEFFAAWYKAATSRLLSADRVDQFDQQALANIFYAHGQLGVALPKDFAAVWYKAATSRLLSADRADQFDQQALANIFYAHGQLGVALPKDFAAVWYKAATSRLLSADRADQFDQQALANIFYAHGLLEIKPTTELLACIKKLDIDSLSIEGAHMVYLTIKALRLELQFSAGTKFAKVLEASRGLKPTTSKFQDSVISSLKRLNLQDITKIETELFIECISSPCDIYFELNGKKIIVEADGPTHYLADGMTLNPPTLLKSRILVKQGYIVIRVPYFDWDHLKNDESRQDYLKKAILHPGH